MRNKKTRYLTHAALIAAIYVVLTYLANLFGLANGAIQVRLSEALTVLPVFTPAAIPGLFIGCITANLLTGCALWDVVFGSLATLIGAVGTFYLGKVCKGRLTFITTLPPIIANTVIVPFVIRYVYAAEDALPFLFLTVGLGEVISCGVLGFFLIKLLAKYQDQIF